MTANGTTDAIYLRCLGKSFFLLHMPNNQKPSTHKKAQVYAQLKAKYLDYYSKLPIQKLAADFIGKDEDTIIRWKKDDMSFADQVASAKSAWALEKASKVKSTEWLLERVLNEHFTEKRHRPACLRNY